MAPPRAAGERFARCSHLPKEDSPASFQKNPLGNKGCRVVLTYADCKPFSAANRTENISDGFLECSVESPNGDILNNTNGHSCTRRISCAHKTPSGTPDSQTRVGPFVTLNRASLVALMDGDGLRTNWLLNVNPLYDGLRKVICQTNDSHRK